MHAAFSQMTTSVNRVSYVISEQFKMHMERGKAPWRGGGGVVGMHLSVMLSRTASATMSMHHAQRSLLQCAIWIINAWMVQEPYYVPDEYFCAFACGFLAQNRAEAQGTFGGHRQASSLSMRWIGSALILHALNSITCCCLTFV